MKSKHIDYIPEIDHLRFAAAVLVFGYHFFHYFVGGWSAFPGYPYFGLITEGHIGVSLFFVLSGYIFMRIALNVERIRYGPFLRNRVLRIGPLYLVIFVLAISMGRDRFEATDVLHVFLSNIGDAPTSWYFATGPAWSISVEMAFYVIFPFLAEFARRAGLRYLLRLVVILLFAKLALYLATENSTHALFSTLVGRLDQFLIGMGAAMLAAQRQAALARLAPLLLPLALLVLFVAVSVQAGFASFLADDQKQPLWIVWGTVEALVWAAVILTYVTARPRLPWKLSALLSRGGMWSYSFYMWHAVVIFCVHELLAARLGTEPLALVLTALGVLGVTLVVSWLSFTTIEQPFLALRRSYAGRRPSSEAAEA